MDNIELLFGLLGVTITGVCVWAFSYAARKLREDSERGSQPLPGSEPKDLTSIQRDIEKSATGSIVETSGQASGHSPGHDSGHHSRLVISKASVQRPIQDISSEASSAAQASSATVQSSLKNTKASFLNRIRGIFGTNELLSAGDLENLEEILFTSDIGPTTVAKLMAAVESQLKSTGQSGNFESVRLALRDEMMSIMKSVEATAELNWPNANGATRDLPEMTTTTTPVGLGDSSSASLPSQKLFRSPCS
jgi:signal recognition particle GTPase